MFPEKKPQHELKQKMPLFDTTIIRTSSPMNIEQWFQVTVAGLQAGPRELHESTLLVLDSAFFQLT